MRVCFFGVAKVVTSHHKHLKHKAMKSRIVLLAVVIAGLSSCATYRTGQTPDDVYYSPAREVDGYVETNREDDRTTYNTDRLEDQRLRQQIRDQRFRSFDDDFYWNNPRFSNNWGWNSWNSPYGWNTWGSNWNTWSLGWNSWNTWNNPYGWNTWNSPFVCVPGTTIIIPGPGAPKNSQGIRYSPSVQNFTTGNVNRGGKFGNTSTNTGSGRYYGGASNNNRRSSFFSDFFGGGSNNNSGGSFFGNGSGGSRSFGSGSSSGSRSFGSGGSSSGGSSSGGSKPSGGTGGRRN
jgi:hypothetical protein